jgi:hypothetical protein
VCPIVLSDLNAICTSGSFFRFCEFFLIDPRMYSTIMVSFMVTISGILLVPVAEDFVYELW